MTTGIPGFLLLAGFLLAALVLSGWRAPLAGFGLLVIGAHALEPQITFVTPLAFLALGLAGAEEEGVAVSLPSLMASAVAATCCWMIIAVGSWELFKPGATLDSTLGKLRTARTFLHPWEQPYVLTGSVQSRLFTVGQHEAGPIARSAFAQAAAREPDDAIPLVNLAKMDRELGSLTEAHRELERALVINPQSASVRNGMAALAVAEGDVATARRLYGESLQIQPGDNSAKAALAQLPA